MKRAVKKYAALVLAILVAVTSIPNIGAINVFAKSIFGSVLNNAEVPVAPTFYERGANTIRKVVDVLDDLPQAKAKRLNPSLDITTLTTGSKDKPFFILEIVPYLEYAEFGYHIGGCEPIDVENCFGLSDNSKTIPLSVVDSFKTGKYKQINDEPAIFFPDEKEGKMMYYNATFTPMDVTTGYVDGYYEFVVSGGDFKIVSVDGVKTMEKVSAGTGDFVWHTINAFDGRHDAHEYTDSFDRASLTKGDRIYTKRECSAADPALDFRWRYLYYENNENFLTDTLLLTKQQAANYSVCIKTITPSELNSTPDWIDYADLIIISPKTHNEKTASLWKFKNKSGEYINRLKKTPGASYRDNQFEYDDLDGDVALKIFKKATEDTNYAAVVIDNRVYDMSQPTLSTKTKKSVNAKVYDWNLNYTGQIDSSRDASCNNIFKLTMMLVSMDSYIVRNYYLDESNPLIVVEGNELVNKLQTGTNAYKYWSGYTLQLIDPDFAYSSPANRIYEYTNSPYTWQNFGVFANLGLSSYKSFAIRHVYTYNGDSSMLSGYIGSGIDADNAMLPNGEFIFEDFVDYINDPDNADFNIDPSVGADSSDALRYALGIRASVPTYGKDETLRILDIEPSVGLKWAYQDGYSHSVPTWKITKNYFKMLLTDFRGDIELTHMTTAEFVGKTEDLNSCYDLIYFGMDSDAYFTRSETVKVPIEGKVDEYKTVTMQVTDFNDNSLDGKIYFHIGDILINTAYTTSDRNRSAKFLFSTSTNSLVNSEVMRWPGNDISNIKKKELDVFVQSQKPVVVALDLYNLDEGPKFASGGSTVLIDSNTNVYKFINEHKAAMANPVYSTADVSDIQHALRKTRDKIEFTSVPAIYNGRTNFNSNVISSPNYLSEKNALGDALLRYKFTVNGDGYYYRLYVDQDRDGKFDSSEIVKTGNAANGNNEVVYTLSSSIIGLVQWKLEVIKLSNTAIRNNVTGCSAVQRTEGTPKEEIRVLQIMPKSGNYAGWLNLQNNETYKKYYSNLKDFKVTVRTITLEDFQKFFVGTGFSFDMSQPISDTNPVNLDKVYEKTVVAKKHKASDNSENGSEELLPLNKYNMIIVGFGDSYGGMDFSNDNGALEYLQYHTTVGKSILYTHDFTSIYNVKKNGIKTFGYSANSMMRDLMGMNRYKAVFNELSDTKRNQLISYQEANAGKYDSIGIEEKHGCTYFAMKRFAWDNNGDRNANVVRGYKTPFRFLIYKVQNPSEYIQSANNVVYHSGFTNMNDPTKKATKINEGQITQYPYYIDDTLNIAETHGQWYQLNVEDPEVTVWYTLTDSGSNADGSSTAYNASYNDTANNYYIYSKGNIFYSGVGHSTAAGDAEAKLFVNTMIAAYRRSYDAPMAEVEKTQYSSTNAAGTSSATLTTSVLKLSEENYIVDLPENYDTTPYIRIYFRTKDFSLSNNLKYRISSSAASAEYKVNEIFYATDYMGDVTIGKDTAVSAAPDGYIEGLKNNQLYYFYYPISNLLTSDVDYLLNTVLFEGKNDRSEDAGLTYLELYLHELFQLD